MNCVVIFSGLYLLQTANSQYYGQSYQQGYQQGYQTYQPGYQTYQSGYQPYQPGYQPYQPGYPPPPVYSYPGQYPAVQPSQPVGYYQPAYPSAAVTYQPAYPSAAVTYQPVTAAAQAYQVAGAHPGTTYSSGPQTVTYHIPIQEATVQQPSISLFPATSAAGVGGTYAVQAQSPNGQGYFTLPIQTQSTASLTPYSSSNLVSVLLAALQRPQQQQLQIQTQAPASPTLHGNDLLRLLLAAVQQPQRQQLQYNSGLGGLQLEQLLGTSAAAGGQTGWGNNGGVVEIYSDQAIPQSSLYGNNGLIKRLSNPSAITSLLTLAARQKNTRNNWSGGSEHKSLVPKSLVTTPGARRVHESTVVFTNDGGFYRDTIRNSSLISEGLDKTILRTHTEKRHGNIQKQHVPFARQMAHNLIHGSRK